MRSRFIAPLMYCALLAACSGDKAGADGAQADDGLPKPGAVSGSVTGMPNPGTASAQPIPATAQAPDIIELPDEADADETPADEAALSEATEPQPGVAVEAEAIPVEETSPPVEPSAPAPPPEP